MSELQMSESLMSETDVRDSYSFAKSKLLELSEEGRIITAFFHGSFISTPDYPNDIDILVLLHEEDPKEIERIEQLFNQHRSVELTFFRPEDVLAELTKNTYEKKEHVLERTLELMKCARFVKNKNLSKIIRLLGLRSLVVSKGIDKETRFEEFLSFSQDLGLENRKNFYKVTKDEDALTFIDEVISDEADEFDENYKHLAFGQKLNLILTNIKNRLSKSDWKYISRILSDISWGRNFTEAIFAQGAFDIFDNKFDSGSIVEYLKYLVEMNTHS